MIQEAQKEIDLVHYQLYLDILMLLFYFMLLTILLSCYFTYTKKGRKIPNVFARALRLDVLTDVVIKVGASDKSIRAHKCVLGARSAVLERMFVNSEKKKEQPTTIPTMNQFEW